MIATLVASNSGRPGGSCRKLDGGVDHDKLHAGHRTQEEDVVSNWLLTASESRRVQSEVFRRISDAFGLCTPAGQDTQTLQGVDYTTAGPRMYADAWCCTGASLSHKTAGCATFNTAWTYPTTLVFCAGPNAAEPRCLAPQSSLRRTFSRDACDNLLIWEQGIAWAVYAALYASAACGCDAVLIPFVGGGLYAGKHGAGSRDNLRTSFVVNIDKMLHTGEMPDGTRCAPLGRHFREVHAVFIDR